MGRRRRIVFLHLLPWVGAVIGAPVECHWRTNRTAVGAPIVLSSAHQSYCRWRTVYPVVGASPHPSLLRAPRRTGHRHRRRGCIHSHALATVGWIFSPTRHTVKACVPTRPAHPPPAPIIWVFLLLCFPLLFVGCKISGCCCLCGLLIVGAPAWPFFAETQR